MSEMFVVMYNGFSWSEPEDGIPGAPRAIADTVEGAKAFITQDTYDRGGEDSRIVFDEAVNRHPFNGIDGVVLIGYEFDSDDEDEGEDNKQGRDYWYVAKITKV